MAPRVSILLPVRNAASTLPEALRSLQAQSLADFEVILVDDGSSDDSVSITRTTWGDDPRLRLLTPGRVGLIEALRVGLDACKAELVARMDADDIAMPERLAQQVALADERPEVAAVACLVECFPAENVAEGYRLYETWINGLVEHDEIVREIFVESPLAHPSVLFRKQSVVDVGGYRDRDWPEDYDLWLRLYRAGHRFAKVPHVLLRWREDPQRHSRTHPRYSEDAFLRCKSHHLTRGPLRDRGDIVVWGAGAVGRRLAKYLREDDVSIAAWVDIDPKKIGRHLHDAPIVAPEELKTFRSRFLIAAVGSRGARRLIRERLVSLGWRENDEFLFAA
ncbi:MAG: glycosyltransferase [Myxococcota bacterium]